MKSVVIVQRRLTHYRIQFLQKLRETLWEDDIRLDLFHGVGTPQEAKKNDEAQLSWAEQLPTRYFLNGKLCWQPVHRYVRPADLVIVTQENALLANYLLMFMPRKFKLAFWGHGGNMQSTNPNGLKERFKRWTTKQVDWWFAYSQVSAELVKKAGFPTGRITVVNNAIDTSGLRQEYESVTRGEVETLRLSLGLGEGPVGIFLGSFHKHKRLDFLLAACDQLRENVDDFSIILIGDGQEREKVRQWSLARPWAVWAGPKFARDKTIYLALADVVLNPGATGLGMLDSFACETPLITTDCRLHGPEIAYLENGQNGVITADSISDYVDNVVQILNQPYMLRHLQEGCCRSAQQYTLENMTLCFALGIKQALTHT